MTNAMGRMLLDVLFPRGCAGCSAPDEILCARCASCFDDIVTRAMPRKLIASGAILSCAEYSGVVRHAILQWKDHGDIEAGVALCSHLAGLVRRAAARDVEDGDGQGLEWACGTGVVAVVPAPSSPASRSRRGRLQTRELADAVAVTLRDQGIDARVVEGLAMAGARGQKKSVQTSDVRSRQTRSHGGMRVVAHRFPRGCRGVVLVDDICTTGSTLLGCARVLHAAQMRTLAAFSLASVSDSGDSRDGCLL
jgi:predicted amidophosphoribosyltransferase